MIYQQLLDAKYPQGLRKIIESLGVTFYISNIKFFLKNDSITLEVHKSNKFLESFYYAWSFFFDSSVDKNTYIKSSTRNIRKYRRKLAFRMEVQQNKNKYIILFKLAGGSDNKYKRLLGEITETAYKCSKDEILKKILETYSEEVLNTNKPLSGIAKITEIFAHTAGSMRNFEKKNNLSQNFLKDIRTSCQVERHIVTTSPAILSPKECRNRIRKLIFMHINKLSYTIPPEEIFKEQNSGEKFIDSFNTFEPRIKYTLFILASNKGPLSKDDFVEEIAASKAYISNKNINTDLTAYKFIKQSLSKYIEIRSKDEEYMIIIKEDYVEAILIYYISKNTKIIRTIINEAVFLNQLFSLFEKNIDITPDFKNLIRDKVLSDFEILYGCDTTQYVDGSYGTKEKNYTNKALKIASFFDLKEDPEILYKLQPKIKELYLKHSFFDEPDYIELIRCIYRFMKLDEYSLLSKYFDYAHDLDDIYKFIQLAGMFKKTYSQFKETEKDYIRKKVLETAKNEVTAFHERLNNQRDIRNLFSMPTSGEIEHSQWLMYEITLFFKLSLGDEEEKLEDIWDDLFFEEKEKELI